MKNETTRKVFRTCSLCEATCGLELEIQGDRVIKVRGDAEDVFSGGYICPKGTAIARVHEDPDRLRSPLVKRNGKHVEVSWDEAFAEIEKRLLPIMEKNGRDSVAAYLGNPNVHNLAGAFYVRPVLKALGTRNIYSASTVDQIPRHVSSGALFGAPGTIPVPDLDRTDFLLMLGANPLESNGSLCTAPDFPGRLKAIQKRGGRIVVIDPRRTRTARLADEHLFVRPGSDALALAAMIHTLFEEDLVDLGSVAEHINGLDEVRVAVQPFSPERVAERCGIEAGVLRRLARELAAAERGAVYGRIGIHTVSFGTLASWATDVLNILTGNLDRPGGSMFPKAPGSRAQQRAGGRGFATGRWKSRVRELPEVMGEFPVATLADEMETDGEGQVRALVTIGGNPALSTPDSERLEKAIENLDFMVSVDIYCNETTRHADVILPPPSLLERGHYDLSFASLAVRNVANYSPPVFEAQGPSEAVILARLAGVIGGQGADAKPEAIDDMMQRGLIEGHIANPESPIHGAVVDEVLARVSGRPGPEALLDIMLRMGPYGDGFDDSAEGLSLERLEARPHGIDLGPLEPRVPEILSTPSARIELAGGDILTELDRLDRVLAEAEPEGLLLIGRRHLRSNNSWMHNVESLVKGQARCTLQMHPDDARERELANGSLASIASRVGQIAAPVEISDDLMPGVVSLPHGWGHGQPGSRLSVAAAHPGVNSNRLTDGRPLDPLSGNAVLNAIPVEVSAPKPS
ncbi:MAG: molybdopterin oxidoreductase family protein [Myxococcota bacterium]|jgi:anaerobic selenocysteine-containing dehydrogenase|nr:molybdopterin oxidoreductase family protein [Myxococcota bacterium]